MIFQRWVGAGGLALALCAGLPAHGEPLLLSESDAPHKTVRVPLLDRDPCEYPKISYCTQPTDVHIGRYLLKIPYNLIGQWPPTKDFIELLPRWPGLKGAVKNEKATINFDSFDIIHILISSIRPREPTEAGIQDLIHRLKLSPPTPLPEIGLLEYRNPRVNNAVFAYMPINKISVLPRGQPLFIDSSGGPVKRGNDNTIECEVNYTIRDGLYVTVRFARRHLGDWKKIITSTRDLIESFIQE